VRKASLYYRLAQNTDTRYE